MSLADKKIYGLIGYPVKHSLSHFMHNAAFQALKINAEYNLFELRPPDLESFLKSILQRNIHGLNVTIPYKEKTISFLDAISDEAKLVGAINTIKVSDNKLEGFNTDGEGFLRHLIDDLRFDPEDKEIAILGAGGAAKAIAVYLSKNKPKRIAIYDMDETKAVSLVNQLKKFFANIEFQSAHSITELNIGDSDLLINATPIGMKETDLCLIEGRFIHRGMLVYDLVYNPPETKLLKMAKERSAKVSNGLGMLLYQGARSFELWTGKSAPIDIMRQALEEGAKRI